MPDFEMPDEVPPARAHAPGSDAGHAAVGPVAEDAPVAEDGPGAVDAPGTELEARASSMWQGSDAPDAGASSSARSRLADTWRRRRGTIVAFVAGLAVAALALGVVASVREASGQADVERALDDYLAAVADGDAAIAAGLDGALATPALVEAGVVPESPAEVSCGRVAAGGLGATADCRVEVDGEVDAMRVVLERSDGRWQVTRGLEVPVRIQSGVLRVVGVEGAALDDDVALGRRAAWLLPGRYVVEARTAPQLAIDRLEGLVVTPAGGSVRWTATIPDALEADAGRAAVAYLEACAAQPTDGCPALQPRDPAEAFEAFDVVGRLEADDPYAIAFEVRVRRPAGQGREFVAIDVRVDFGESLDAYEVLVS